MAAAVDSLLYVGRATERRLRGMGVRTIGDLAAMNRSWLRSSFGRHGETMYDYANGLDGSIVLREGEYPAAKSVGNGTTTPRDMRSRADACLS